ncbi:hypothetical protein [Desertivirga xinjiangensis]|uniref:hypothetical protein n=1 Tax=Desertivirga xinjiangensis TaxID=539206 RepID=UPI00210A76DD|nr:hypothetical protein [Pedobacter xinjiangensis]
MASIIFIATNASVQAKQFMFSGSVTYTEGQPLPEVQINVSGSSLSVHNSSYNMTLLTT